MLILTTVCKCKHVISGVSTITIAISPLVSFPAYSQDAREVPGFSAPTTTPTKTVDYDDWLPSTPLAPTTDRPYYYVKFDQEADENFMARPPKMSTRHHTGS